MLDYMKRFTALLSLLTVFILGCVSNSTSPEGNYQLSELTGYEIPENASVSMTVTPGRIAGKGPINNWSGPIQDGKIGMMIGTRMAGPPELMDMEMKLYQALDSAMLEVDANTLNLSKDGEIVAKFTRAD